MKSAAFLFFILTLATSSTSVLARPPVFETEDYTDNNIANSIPVESDHNVDEDERSEYVEM
jgi:hypothetical protein